MMKKGLWIGLAVCSLAVMTACGNEAKETAAAPTESAVTQQPAEQAAQVEKPEAEAAPEVEAAVETAAEQPEPSDMSEEPQTFTDADKQLVIDYVDQVEPTIDVAQSTMINLSQSILAWQNYEIEDEDLRKSLVSSNTAFTLLEYEASRIEVPDLEYAPLYEALSEVHAMLLDMGVKGRQGVDLFIEALDTQEQAALDKAYDEAFVSFESYEGRMEPILKDVQRMVDAR